MGKTLHVDTRYRRWGGNAPLPDIWALARGTRAGRPTSVAVYPHAKLPGRMGGHTGIPLAPAVELLRQGRIGQVGVHTPATAIDPEDFFGLYARLTQPPAGSVDEVLTIVEERDCTVAFGSVADSVVTEPPGT
ncbi:hypothetical protein ACQP1V_27585 [Microtetraspora malaysiensis]|uniref:hypothetical protein n=1 Tax=Microtetraspora malaysiensis TaxID=161358 RepID=UPI003D8F04BC